MLDARNVKWSGECFSRECGSREARFVSRALVLLTARASSRFSTGALFVAICRELSRSVAISINSMSVTQRGNVRRVCGAPSETTKIRPQILEKVDLEFLREGPAENSTPFRAISVSAMV